MIYVNPALVQMFGYADADEMMERFHTGFISGCILREMAKDADQPVHLERMMRRDGRLIDTEIHTHSIILDSESQLMGVVLDVTRRVREARLREEIAQRLQIAVQSGSIGLWEWNVQTDRVYYSPEWKKQLGHEPEEISDHFREWYDRVHPDDIEPTMEVVARYLEQRPQGGYETEFRMRHRDGSYRWILSRGAMISEGDSVRQSILLGTHIDITDQKKREEAIQLLEHRHRFALETLGVGEWESNPATGEISRSPLHDRIFGYEEPLPYWSIERFMSHVLPEDRPQVQQAMEYIRREKLCSDTHCRIRRPDGEIRWIYGRGRIRTDAAGTEMVAGVIMDITDQQRTALALRDSEARLALFIEHAPAALAMFDRNMCYLVASRRWREDYQLQAADLAGQSHYELFPAMPEHWREAHRQGLGGQQVSCEEDIYTWPNGRQQWLNWAIHPWYSADGQVGGIILFTSDITERKQGQLLLAESESRFRNLFEHLPVAYQSLDIHGNWVDANDKMAELLGFDSPEQMIGLDFCHFWDDSIRDQFDTAYDEFKAEHRVEGELKLVRRDGVTLTVLVSGRIQRDVEGRFLRTHCVVIDVTEQRRMENSIRELNAGLERKVEERTEALRLSELKARQIIACSPIAMLLVREDGHIELAARRANYSTAIMRLCKGVWLMILCRSANGSGTGSPVSVLCRSLNRCRFTWIRTSRHCSVMAVKFRWKLAWAPHSLGKPATLSLRCWTSVGALPPNSKYKVPSGV